MINFFPFFFIRSLFVFIISSCTPHESWKEKKKIQFFSSLSLSLGTRRRRKVLSYSEKDFFFDALWRITEWISNEVSSFVMEFHFWFWFSIVAKKKLYNSFMTLSLFLNSLKVSLERAIKINPQKIKYLWSFLRHSFSSSSSSSSKSQWNFHRYLMT